MKIAIVLCGHLRSFRQTHASFLRLKNEFEKWGEVDVFCHTWDTEESNTASWWKDHGDNVVQPHVKVQELVDLYAPCTFQIEPGRIFEEIPLKIKSIIPLSGILSMLYSQFGAFRLLDDYRKKNNISYDLIIKTRYDLEYELSSAFTSQVNSFTNGSCLWIPNTNSYELTGAYADVFAIGTEKPMSEYLLYYERFSEIIPFYESYSFREFVPELCLKTYLDKYQIPVKEPAGLRVNIRRSNGYILKLSSDKHFDNNEPLCFYRQTYLKNRAVLPENPDLFIRNTNKLIAKYLLWLDNSISDTIIQQYQQFYFGKWIGLSSVNKLIQITKVNSIIEKRVFKSFFEEALWSSHYGFFKKLALAGLLAIQGKYGLYYFKVILNQFQKKAVTNV